MDTERILQLAQNGAKQQWDQRRKELEQQPHNRIRKSREAAAWKELKDLEQIIRAWTEGSKDNGNN